MQRLASSIFRWLGVAAIAWSGFVQAQDGATLSKERIDQLTAPIALYPDSLLSQVLMASTYPADVAEAAKWSRANAEMKGDEAVMMVEGEPWDPSVQSLVAFPQVIILMGENPTWVKDLGDAFLVQPEDVMDSIQRLRAAAQRAGNLESNEQVKVIVEQAQPSTTTTVVQAPPQQIIVNQPAQPQVVFVPQYNPTVIFGVWPHPLYPPIYIAPPPGFWFSRAVVSGIAWGVGIGVRNALWGGVHWGWGRSSVNINVTRYNNININRRLDVNGGSTRWNHNVDNRRGVPYRGGDATRRDLERRYQAGSREAYRGRDDSRQRALQAMQDRGIQGDQGTARERAQNAGRDAVQNPGQRIDRNPAAGQGAGIDRSAVAQRAQNVDRSAVADRARDVDRSGVNNRAQAVNAAPARDRVQTADLRAMESRAQATNRDNAFRGAGDRNAGQQISRGNASREAMQQLPQVQRPAGNTGGGARAPAPRPSGGNAAGGARPNLGGDGGGRVRQPGGRP